MADTAPPPYADLPLPPGVGDPAVTIAWDAHVAAGRIGTPAPRDEGADHGCAGLAAALGWRSAAGRFTPLPDAASGFGASSASSTSAPSRPASDLRSIPS